MVYTFYKIANERTQTVIRSQDWHFLHQLADFLAGNPVHSGVVEQMKVFSRDLRDVLGGKVAGHIVERSID